MRFLLSFSWEIIKHLRPSGAKPALTVREVVDPGLVFPVNHGIFCPGSLGDGWVFLLPPHLDTGKILFPGALDRTMARQSPAPHIIRHTAV